MSEQIIYKHRSLGNNSSCSLRSRQIAAISDSKNIVKLRTLESLLIYFHPASSIGQIRVFKERVGFLVRHYVKQVVVSFGSLLGFRVNEVRDSVLVVHLDQLSLQVLLDSSHVRVSLYFGRVFS